MTETEKLKLECFDWIFEHLIILPDKIIFAENEYTAFFHEYYEKISSLKFPVEEVDVKIIDSELSTRTKHALLRSRIKTVSELSKLSKVDLRRTRNIGTISIKEIEHLLYMYGYELREY